MSYSIRNDYNRAAFRLALLFFLLVCAPPPIYADVRYDITASYNEKKHTIEGTTKITFTNSGESPLSEIYLFLYPNFYKEKYPNNQKDQYSQAYPVAFNPGSIEIVSIEDPEGNKLVSADFFGSKTLSEIRLGVPIPPKTPYHLLIQFVTQIPERYGVFGYFRDWVTLQGGWHPYLPPLVNGKWDIHGLPPPSQFHVDMTVPKGMDFIASTSGLMPYYSLSIGREMIRKEKAVHDVDLVYTYSKRNERYGEQVFKTAELAISFFSSSVMSLPKMNMQLTHASLYKDIVTAGARLLYVDSRLFKVFPLLKQFHEIRVAKGVFKLLWQEIIPWEAPWVSEMMAEITADQFAKQRYPKEIQLRSWLKPISFLPLIDQILYAEDPLLHQIYFRKLASESETILSFHQSTLPYYPRLKKIFSPELLEKVITDYKQRVQSGEKPQLKIRFMAHGETTPAIKQFFEKELLATDSIDFGIKRVVRKRVGESYQTTIDIKKEGLGVEPLEIVLSEKDGTKIPLLWNGEENRYQTVVTTLSPVDVVEIDPDEITRDTYRGNNRDPEQWKVLLKRINLGYNVTTQFVDYDIGLRFQPVYSIKNSINLSYLHSAPKDVGSIRYSRVLSNQHVVTTGFSAQSPNRIPDLVLEEAVRTANLSYSLRYPNIPFVQEYMEWLTGRYPQWDIAVGIDKNLTANGGNYIMNAVFDLHRSFVFSNYHQVQARLMTGVSTGALLKSNRFFLGGENGLRGYTPLRFGGENMNLFSLEYRFPLLYETDINFFGLVLTHTLQGVVFSDVGIVAPRSELFNLNEYKSDAGCGILWFVDFLGIMPMAFGFNAAWPINSPVAAEDKPHYYISGGRLF